MPWKTFHKGKYYVTFKRGFEDSKRDITVTIDKVFETDSLRISLSDDDDPTFLCVLNVTRLDYEDLKKQQGLLIDFDNFPSQLVRLLQQCASNNMFLIMQQTNPIQFYFEIVEHNDFKRLVHLSLKTGPATDFDIKEHMADTILNIKKAYAALKMTSSSTEAILNDKCVNMERKILDLSHALTKMEEDKLRRDSEYQEAFQQEKDRLAQERLQCQRNMEQNAKMQLSSSQDELNRKEKQIEELNAICKQLKSNISLLENQLSDKSQRLNLLETEVQKSHIEVATLKAKNATLDREVADKEKKCQQLNSRCAHLEKTINDNTETIKDLSNSLHLAKREKISIEERLASSESLAARNNEAAHSTSEQLLKANQIISKQNSDIMEIKEKLVCRTAIALEQEKVIERNTKEIEELQSHVAAAMQSIDKLKEEFNGMKEKYETSQTALKERDETIKNNNMVIQWLHKKMENNCAPTDDTLPNGRCTPTSSTPYFLARNNNTKSSEGLSEESINFYATSRLSSGAEDSPQVDPLKAGKTGLDPKYLKPSTDDNQLKTMNKGPARLKSADSQSQKGKENRNVDLPKVDYREKKSSRPTYRATPVSAYFP